MKIVTASPRRPGLQRKIQKWSFCRRTQGTSPARRGLPPTSTATGRAGLKKYQTTSEEDSRWRLRRNRIRLKLNWLNQFIRISAESLNPGPARSLGSLFSVSDRVRLSKSHFISLICSVNHFQPRGWALTKRGRSCFSSENGWFGGEMSCLCLILNY